MYTGQRLIGEYCERHAVMVLRKTESAYLLRDEIKIVIEDNHAT